MDDKRLTNKCVNTVITMIFSLLVFFSISDFLTQQFLSFVSLLTAFALYNLLFQE